MGRRSNIKSREQGVSNALLARVMLGLIVMCAAFAAGFLVRGNNGILERFGFDTSTGGASVNPGMTVSGSTFDSLAARVAEIQGILDEESLDALELGQATTSVLSAASEATGDPYVRYYDADRYTAYLKDVSGSYAGVGVLFGEKDSKAYAVDVFEGSEAESKGVLTGDFVVAIDGDRGNNDGWTQAETVKTIARAEGESVVITWRRPSSIDADGGQEYTITLVCTDYPEANVVAEYDDEVGYIKLAQITQNADALVKQAIDDLAEQGARSFVLDLRDNPGGYLTQAVDLASLFVKSGVIVEIESKAAQSNRTASGATATDAPLVVIVNENTAGTAEVLAGALQDNNRASLYGIKTMGKGSVQSIKELSFGGALRYTSAYYRTPLGYDINGNGINPDVQVAQAGEGDDTQKTLALESARSLIEQ